jgi:hypothetical protein
MSNRRLSSPYVRYLKARLWNLTRPSFWGTAIFLSVVGLTMREFLVRPGILASRQAKPAATQPETSSTLTKEDRAIAADIDNIPILNYDSDQSEESSLDTSEPISKPNKGKENPLQEAVKNQNALDAKSNSSLTTLSAPAPAFKYDNPFLAEAQNLLQFGGSVRNRNTDSNTVNLSNQALQSNQLASNLNQRYRTNNSLETALNSSPTQPSFNQVINRGQPAAQNSSFLQTSGNFNTPPQNLTNTQFTQPNINTQPTTYYGNFNTTQPPVNYTNLNGAIPSQTPTYSNFNAANPTLQRTYNSNNFNNTQPLFNNTPIPQTSTVAPSIPTNTVTNTAVSTQNPTNPTVNGTLITPVVQPNQFPQNPAATQRPNSGLFIRY